MGILNSLQRRFAQRRNRRRTENPSILDYNQNERKLVLDMSGIKARLNAKSRAESDATSLNDNATDMQSISNKSSTSFSQEEVEWSLPLVDKEVTEPQTMEEEIKRLKTLSDYFVLDSDGEEEFDRLTRMGSRMFDVPMCLISLVDLGRQWFLSKVGLDAAETPRKHAFCAHVILNKYKILVVPDATQDFRFKDNPLVTGPPDVRFYAGAALISPEGYKLGTFCIISPVPRPQGLSEAEQELLHNMAATTVSTMVARRNRLVKEEYEGRFLTSARSLLETNQNVEKSQKILVELLQKEAWNLDSETGAEISAVSRNLAMVSNVCSALARSMLEAGMSASPEQTDSTNDNNGGAEEKKEMDDDASMRVSTSKKVEDIMKEYDMITSPTTDMVQFFDNINAIIPSFTFQGQVSVEIDGSVPKVIIAEDLLLFRSTLNMLTHCMGQINSTEPSKADPALQKSGLRIRRMKRSGDELLVQCLQAGPPIESARAKELFRHKDSLLGPVATMVRTLGGRYGMYHGKWNPNESDATAQSLFWFQIPYETETYETLKESMTKIHHPKNYGAALEGSSHGSPTKPLDPFQAALLEVGCGGRR